jgi:hypothetical protein
VEYAKPGEYTCLYRYWDDERQAVVACGGAVPEGELTSLAFNAFSATFLALCVRHREALAESMQEWLAAGVGQGRVDSTRDELRDGKLVSHTRLRAELLKHGLAGKNGPLNLEQRLKGVELLYGPEEREYLEAQESAT